MYVFSGRITIICQTPSPPYSPPCTSLSDYSTDDVYGRSLEEDVAISPSTAGTYAMSQQILKIWIQFTSNFDPILGNSIWAMKRCLSAQTADFSLMPMLHSGVTVAL